MSRSCSLALPMAIFAAVLAAVAGDRGSAARDDKTVKHSKGRELPKLPEIKRPVMFNTPEADAILASLQVFPADNAWNEDISKLPVHANSKNLIASVGTEKPLQYNLDMCFIIVPPDQKKVEVKIVANQGEKYPDESDSGPFPVPDNAPIEDWPLNKKDLAAHQREAKGDRHMIVVDPTDLRLYEFYHAQKTDAGWTASQTSVFDLKSNNLRPTGWTS